MPLDLQANKEKFIQIFKGEITREGADAVLEWLENSDFFEAPYTGSYVLSCKGGACLHALHTFRALTELVEKHREANPFILCDPELLGTPEGQAQAIAEVNQSIAIVGLLAFVGSANSWVLDSRNVKNKQTGKWDAVPYYSFQEEFMFGGAGGKAVFILMNFMRLAIEEAQAIRFIKQGKEIPYGSSFEDAFYGVYETNMLAAMAGVAHNEAHNIYDKLVWDQIKPVEG